MLNASPITDAIAAALRSIPDLAAAMTVLDANQRPVIRINPFHYRLGQENRLAEAVYVMPAPSMLVVWKGSKFGSFNGYQVWKHRWDIYYRMGNAAGVANPVGYEDLWALTCNGPCGSHGQNIRNIEIYPGLDIMEKSEVDHAVDEDLIDRFQGFFIIPEIGDQ